MAQIHVSETGPAVYDHDGKDKKNKPLVMDWDGNLLVEDESRDWWDTKLDIPAKYLGRSAWPCKTPYHTKPVRSKRDDAVAAELGLECGVDVHGRRRPTAEILSGPQLRLEAPHWFRRALI